MKYILVLVAIVLSTFDAAAQRQDMRDVFKHMPDSVLGYLSENNRLDMIDFIDSKMQAKVENGLGGTSRLDTITTDYLRLTLTPASTVEMRLLPCAPGKGGADSTLVCLVATYGDSIRESVVSYYTTRWKAVDGLPDPLQSDKVNNCLSSDSLVSDGFPAVSASVCKEAELSPSSNSMTIKMTIPVFLTDRKIEVKPLDKSITLNWDGTSFK
ncbi:DUF3256 family protein [Marseilla massiliensis]|jgi:hypothetical protein|uniref:DUF3256 family protein n=1 Tax=Marseilla massiliensis TaxID=1841864 RepID=UPI0030C87A6D